MSIKLENGVLTINVSDGKEYLSQRDNEISYCHNNAKVNKCTTCNTTSMVMGLKYRGYVLPKDKKYTQPEDALSNFIITDKKVDDYYKKHLPVMYKEYKDGVEGCYTPNEVHQVLAEATNMWLGCTAVSFSTERKINDIVKELLYGKPVIISGKFEGLHHVVCLVGIKFKTTETKLESVILQIMNGTITPDSWIIDDPWGNLHETKTYKSGASGCGNNIEISNDYFVNNVKPLGNTLTKWGHFFNEPAAIV